MEYTTEYFRRIQEEAKRNRAELDAKMMAEVAKINAALEENKQKAFEELLKISTPENCRPIYANYEYTDPFYWLQRPYPKLREAISGDLEKAQPKYSIFGKGPDFYGRFQNASDEYYCPHGFYMMFPIGHEEWNSINRSKAWLTEEQWRAMDALLEYNHINVTSTAGSGKTSMMVNMVLYLIYNKRSRKVLTTVYNHSRTKEMVSKFCRNLPCKARWDEKERILNVFLPVGNGRVENARIYIQTLDSFALRFLRQISSIDKIPQHDPLFLKRVTENRLQLADHGMIADFVYNYIQGSYEDRYNDRTKTFIPLGSTLKANRDLREFGRQMSKILKKHFGVYKGHGSKTSIRNVFRTLETTIRGDADINKGIIKLDTEDNVYSYDEIEKNFNCLGDGYKATFNTMKAHGILTYTMLELLAMREYTELKHYQDRILQHDIKFFSAAFIDEAQDLNGIQQAFTAAVLRQSNRSAVLGDSKQTIYTYNGSTATLLEENRFGYGGDATQISINTTQRCSKKIVEFSNAIYKTRWTIKKLETNLSRLEHERDSWYEKYDQYEDYGYEIAFPEGNGEEIVRDKIAKLSQDINNTRRLIKIISAQPMEARPNAPEGFVIHRKFEDNRDVDGLLDTIGTIRENQSEFMKYHDFTFLIVCTNNADKSYLIKSLKERDRYDKSIQVETVFKSKGSEADFIVAWNFTEANLNRWIDFKNMLNVAVTRGRYGVVIGTSDYVYMRGKMVKAFKDHSADLYAPANLESVITYNAYSWNKIIEDKALAYKTFMVKVSYADMLDYSTILKPDTKYDLQKTMTQVIADARTAKQYREGYFYEDCHALEPILKLVVANFNVKAIKEARRDLIQNQHDDDCRLCEMLESYITNGQIVNQQWQERKQKRYDKIYEIRKRRRLKRKLSMSKEEKASRIFNTADRYIRVRINVTANGKRTYKLSEDMRVRLMSALKNRDADAISKISNEIPRLTERQRVNIRREFAYYRRRLEALT